ncbi:MAG: TIGR00282 family metallophosphoesterase [Alphaproteobacteria bacterium]|nr:MAG: TIGR00282 family metallophosphoesterase [Alphaproteobacteria bacterium]
MRILFLGDVVGRSGRQAIAAHLPRLRDAWKADFVVVNAENATQGAGLNAAHAEALLAAGADCLTLGDHAFDQREMLGVLTREPRILRPVNIAREAPGQGFRIFEAGRGRKVLVVQVLGRVFMKQPFDDPFSALDRILLDHPLGAAVSAAIVDIHAEATSEKMALGHWCDGRASLAVGTHTHVPTADLRIMAKGCAYQTDAGMCGSYDSIIGMERTEPMRRFVTGMSAGRFTPDMGEATLSGVFVETDDTTGRALRAHPVRVGGLLSQAGPEE